MKKNNKGFSLVELIVVVLIMAIIAVALAPQVMKWVENSRKSTDCSNYDSIVSAANIALTNKSALLESSVAITITSTTSARDWDLDGGSGTGATTYAAFKGQMDSTLGTNWETALAAKAADMENITMAGVTAKGTYQITVKDGIVTRTLAPKSAEQDS